MWIKAFKHMSTVYGGQFGSEGKGGICKHIGMELLERYPGEKLLAYRIGGANAGHTFYLPDTGLGAEEHGYKVVTCQIPGPMFLSPRFYGIIGPEGVIDLHKLEVELIHLSKVNKDQHLLFIDNSAVIVEDKHKAEEGTLVTSIGSTGKGVGRATAAKVLRDRSATIARDSEELADLIVGLPKNIYVVVTDTIAWLRAQVKKNKGPLAAAIIEGTQGAELSLHTSGFYPFATSRECTPQGIWAGCGLSPDMALESDVIMVTRTYPIRVAGPSGPMYNETTWAELSEKIGRDVTEQTTVTKKTRRVAEMDIHRLLRTIFYTRPTSIALTFMDYKVPEVYLKDPVGNPKAMGYIRDLSDLLECHISLVGTGEGHVYRI